jgi:hypothetical protein
MTGRTGLESMITTLICLVSSFELDHHPLPLIPNSPFQAEHDPSVLPFCPLCAVVRNQAISRHENYSPNCVK